MMLDTADRVAAPPIRRYTAEFRRSSLALFAGGFGTFSLLYCVQTLLPAFATDFGVSPARSSLALSLTTVAISVMIVIAGTVSETVGRRGMMIISLATAAILTVLCAFVGTFHQLLVLRLLTGVALSGLPATLIAYIGEEFDSGSVGYAVGLSVAGNAFGGMSGRFAAAAFADLVGWRIGLAALGLVGLICALLFWRLLPPSRHFTRQPFRIGHLLGGLGRPFRDPGLRWLYVSGFLLMGGFVTLYNYIGFHLMAPPFGLSQGWVGALFTVYLVGMVASTHGGALGDRHGRRRVLWPIALVLLLGLLLTLIDRVVLIVFGMAVVTAAFFAAYTVVGSWVTRRAGPAKAQAVALFMFFIYMGSSVMGTLGGVVYAEHGWPGEVALLGALQLALLGIAIRLRFLAPLEGST